ncbi:MAG: LysE family translocator [Hasllibacter sp.]
MLRGPFAVTALNPKSIAFLVAFTLQFIRPDLPAAPQLAVVLVTMTAAGFVSSGAYALLAAWAGGRMRTAPVRRAMTRIGGGVLVALGALTAASRRA